MQEPAADIRERVQAALQRALADLPDSEVADAMRYVCVGGKRVRAMLVLKSARLHGLERQFGNAGRGRGRIAARLQPCP